MSLYIEHHEAKLKAQLFQSKDICTRYSPSSLGSLPRELVLRCGSASLYRYAPSKICHQRLMPLLIVYAFINRPSILDLSQERSLIRRLTERGLTIYLLDWGDPSAEDEQNSLSDYIHRYLHVCALAAKEDANSKKLNLMGVCQGGVLALCYAALYQQSLHRLVTMVTPVDFKTSDNLLAKYASHIDDATALQAFGNIPGEFIAAAFQNLKPFTYKYKKYHEFLNTLSDADAAKLFLQMEQWIFDVPSHPGLLFKEFINKLFRDNLLCREKLMLDNELILLKNIQAPVLNVMARNDHIVPNSSSSCLAKYLSPDHPYQALWFPGGHIGTFVSKSAQRKIPDAIFNWLAT